MSNDGPKSDRDDGDLAGALHDVANGLTVVLGWLAEASSETATEDNRLAAIRVAADRARAARDIARRAIGAADAAMRPRPLGETARQTADALAVMAQRANVRIEIDTPADPVEIEHADEWEQVTTNLLLNAIAHAPAGSSVFVELSRAGGDAVAIVRDEGPGVPRDRRESIFAGDSKRAGGAGVGLRHARALTERRGGTMRLLDSVRGAAFELRWPARRLAPFPPPSSTRPHTLSGVRILVLEDDDGVASLLETALGARGAIVCLAGTQDALTQALGEATYDVVLLDLSPFGASTQEGLERAARAAKDAHLVVMTGATADVPEALESTPMACIPKPFEIPELVAKIAELIGVSAVVETPLSGARAADPPLDRARLPSKPGSPEPSGGS